MSAVIESGDRFPGLPKPTPDAVAAFEAERQEAMDVAVAALGGEVSPATWQALAAMYAFGRLHGIQYARRML